MLYPTSIFDNVYSPENMGKLQRISNALNKALTDAAQIAEHEVFCRNLNTIIASMQSGEFRIPYVGPAFFTKVVQFFFSANPVRSEKDYLPVIADRWIMRALYCEMTERGDVSNRNEIFVIDQRNVFLYKGKKGNISNSYIKYIEYFNKYSKDICVRPYDMEGRLFKNREVKDRFLALVHNQNPDKQLKNIVTLRVYDGSRQSNYGKTFQILDNKITLPHNPDEVYVVYEKKWYEATLGTYCYGSNGNTLRGKDTIQKLIEDSSWQPGQELQAEFYRTEEGAHVYKIQEVPQ